MSVFLYAIGVVLIVILTNILAFLFEDVLVAHLLEMGIMTLVSLLFGGFLGVVKIFLGASLLTGVERNSGIYVTSNRNISRCLFVDYMTLRVYQDYEGR